MEELIKFYQIESDSNRHSAEKMEKYCVENADPDILLDELTEVKKNLNPIPPNIEWRVPFRNLVNKTNEDESIDRAAIIDSMLNEINNKQDFSNCELSETQKLV